MVVTIAIWCSTPIEPRRPTGEISEIYKGTTTVLIPANKGREGGKILGVESKRNRKTVIYVYE